METKPTYEERRRKREKIIALLVFTVLVGFTAVEVHLLKLSSKLPFVSSIFFFGLMNINIVLILLLLFLVFRNAVKMILDEKRGKLGSRLRTRLVFCFTLFAMIPTVFLFSIAAFYIKNSFDKWFNLKVGGTLQRSIDVVKNYYENSEKNASHFARKIAFNFEPGATKNNELILRKIQESRSEYGLDAVEFHADPFSPRLLSTQPGKDHLIPQASLETLQRAFSGANDCKIQNVGEGELVRCSAFLGVGRGVIFADYFIPIALAQQLSEINLTYADYKTDNPMNYPIKSTYFAILIMVSLLILFTATWTGFYVAKRLTIPIEELSKGTEAVAHGNLSYQIPTSGTDEMLKLIVSFNQMTKDLSQNKKDIEATHADLRNINSELSHRRRYIEVLLESVQSGVISIDENGKLSTLNPAACDLLKLSAPDVLGQPYWVIVPDEHRPDIQDLLISVYGTAKPIRRELRIRRKDKVWVTLLATASVLRDESESKTQLGIVVVLDDVTEIQQMERMIAWREVAKRIAHEIKNPLTPIQLSVQRLRRRYLDKIEDDGTFGESTAIILKEVDSLKTMVSEFSAFARLPETNLRRDSLNAIVIDAANLYRAAHESIEFVFELNETLPEMNIDRAQIKRALINLFDNAVAAMEGKGKISVLTEYDHPSGLVRLVVSDQGCGIDEAAYSQLFEPYFSTKQGGTGLGLAIVQRIVTDHGGFVRAVANQPRGTKFTIEFPEFGIRGRKGMMAVPMKEMT